MSLDRAINVLVTITLIEMMVLPVTSGSVQNLSHI